MVVHGVGQLKVKILLLSIIFLFFYYQVKTLIFILCRRDLNLNNLFDNKIFY